MSQEQSASGPPRSARRRARELALQGVYAWLLSKTDSQVNAGEIEAHMRDEEELVHQIDVPYKVAINEAVELAKSFGGTDGFKFVNGVLDKLAAQVRSVEVAAYSARR